MRHDLRFILAFMQAFTKGMQWCCAAGEWDLPYQFDTARWLYIQPRLLVLSFSSALMLSFGAEHNLMAKAYV